MAEEEQLKESEDNKAAPDAEGGSEPQQKPSKLKKMAMIIAPILLLVVGGLYFYFKVMKAPAQDEAEGEKPIQEEVIEEDKKAKEDELITYLDLGQMIIGLAPSSSKRESLRIYITLKLGSQEESEAVLSQVPIIKDSLITFLRSLRSSDFNTSSSTFYLKEEITKRINKIIAPLKVKEVLFQEITVG